MLRQKRVSADMTVEATRVRRVTARHFSQFILKITLENLAYGASSCKDTGAFEALKK